MEFFYQATPGALSAGSHTAVQAAHNFSSSGGLIPDLIIKTTSNDETRWLLVEVKGRALAG